MIKRPLRPLSVVLFSIAMSSIVLSSCATLDKNKPINTLNGIDIDSYEFLDGEVGQYLTGVYLERPTGTTITNSTTQYSGWDVFYEPDNRIWSLYVKASKNPETGKIDATIHFSASPQQYNHATESWDSTPVKPTIGLIQNYNEYVKINHLGRFIEQDGIVESARDDFSFSLSQNLISKIRDGNPDLSLDYIGPLLDITLRREDYDDLSFRISQSEILTALYAIDLGFSCTKTDLLKTFPICEARDL